ncbi:hypothetical protein Unana1_02067 [Umbelopsis nana]
MRLSDFSQWRGNKGDDGAGTGTKVGIAWLGQLCTTDVSLQQQVTREEWKVVAHEIGHGFAPGYVNTKAKPICGNGIREEGEDCDSGGIDDQCCNGRICKFKGNATCE